MTTAQIKAALSKLTGTTSNGKNQTKKGFHYELGNMPGIDVFCKRMAELPKLIKMLMECNGFWWEFDYMQKLVPCGNLTTEYKNGKPFNTNYGVDLLCDRFVMIHDSGIYEFWIPVANPVYTWIRQILEPQYTAKIENIDTTAHTIELPANVLKIAANMASTDSLRPAITCVCIDVKETHVNIVGTDAHCLYKSENLPVIGTLPVGQYLIPGKELKGLKTSAKQPTVTIFITDGEKDKKFYKIGHIEGELLTKYDYGEKANYPEYDKVIPKTYGGKISAQKAEFANNLKICSGAANKTTRQVVLHLNGAIEMSAQDIDYQLEQKIKFPYQNKEGQDITIAFNATLTANVLKQIKSKTLTFEYSTATRAGIFKGENEGIFLQMPLMIGV